MASLTPTIAIEVELSGVGGGWTNLAADTASGLWITHGIRGSTPSDRVASTGTCVFALRNGTFSSGGVLGYYSPHHASVRAGWAVGIGCRVRITDPATSTVYTRFIGRIDRIDPVPGRYRERVVHVQAVDWMDEAARWSLTPDIGEQVNRTWDSVLTAILAEMPSQPTATDFDEGAESWPYALDTSPNAKQKALSEFQKLANSEAGLIYQTADGTLRAEGRHARMTSASSVWTLAETDVQDLELPSSRDDIINTVRVTVHPRTVDSAPSTVVYQQANVIPIAAGATQFLMGNYSDPMSGDAIGATEIQPLIAGEDYAANLNGDGTSTDVTSDFTITVTAGPSGARFEVLNGHAAAAYLTLLRLRGKGIYDHQPLACEATDATSIAAYGELVADFDMPYQASQGVGQGAADHYLNQFKDPLQQARRIRVVGRTTALLTQMLTRDISDKLTLSETVTGVNGDYYINGIECVRLPGGQLQATYTIAPDLDIATYFILDSSALDGADILAPF